MEIQLARPADVRVSLRRSTRPATARRRQPLVVVATRAFVLGYATSLTLLTIHNPSTMSVFLDGVGVVAWALAFAFEA